MAMLDIGRNEDCGVEDGNYEMVAAAPALIGTARRTRCHAQCNQLRLPNPPPHTCSTTSPPAGPVSVAQLVWLRPAPEHRTLLLPDRLNKL